jgi:hypothetical protein
MSFALVVFGSRRRSLAPASVDWVMAKRRPGHLMNEHLSTCLLFVVFYPPELVDETEERRLPMLNVVEWPAAMEMEASDWLSSPAVDWELPPAAPVAFRPNCCILRRIRFNLFSDGMNDIVNVKSLKDEEPFSILFSDVLDTEVPFWRPPMPSVLEN